MGIPLPPPWVILSLSLGFTRHLQNAKEIGSLGFQIITGRGEDAGCSTPHGSGASDATE